MAEEVFVYEDTNIRITNLRAMLQGKTYAMANVTSVSMFTQFASKAPGVLIAVFGGVFVLAGFSGGDLQGCAFTGGFVMLLIGVVMAVNAKNIYWVRIGSASGETNALSSYNRDYIQHIVSAMNDAIVRRG